MTPATFGVSAQCHRVNVVDGHLAALRVKLCRSADVAELREAFSTFTGPPSSSGCPAPRSDRSSYATNPIVPNPGSTATRGEE